MKDDIELKPIAALRALEPKELNNEIFELRKAQFKMRLIKSSGELKQTHLVKNLRRYIAQIKMVMHEKKVGQ